MLHDYSVNFIADCQRIHRVIGLESEGVTRKQAEEFIEQKRTEAREGRLSLPKRRKTHLTFENAARDYIREMEDGNGRNLVAKRRHMRMYLVPFFG